MAKRTSKYALMNAGQLAQETRARGLQKPDVLTLSEWVDWLEGLDTQTVGEPVSEAEAATMPTAEVEVTGGTPYDSMTKAQLVMEARTRKMDISGMTTKAELIDALLASDGVSEDEQAAMDVNEDGR